MNIGDIALVKYKYLFLSKSKIIEELNKDEILRSSSNAHHAWVAKAIHQLWGNYDIAALRELDEVNKWSLFFDFKNIHFATFFPSTTDRCLPRRPLSREEMRKKKS